MKNRVNRDAYPPLLATGCRFFFHSPYRFSGKKGGQKKTVQQFTERFCLLTVVNRHYTAKLSPQAQVRLALGLLK